MGAVAQYCHQARVCSVGSVRLQNRGLAVALAASLFDPAAALIPALFSVWHNVSGPALASYFTWSDSQSASGPVTAD